MMSVWVCLHKCSGSKRFSKFQTQAIRTKTAYVVVSIFVSPILRHCLFWIFRKSWLEMNFKFYHSLSKWATYGLSVTPTCFYSCSCQLNEINIPATTFVLVRLVVLLDFDETSTSVFTLKNHNTKIAFLKLIFY